MCEGVLNALFMSTWIYSDRILHKLPWTWLMKMARQVMKVIVDCSLMISEGLILYSKFWNRGILYFFWIPYLYVLCSSLCRKPLYPYSQIHTPILYTPFTKESIHTHDPHSPGIMIRMRIIHNESHARTFVTLFLACQCWQLGCYPGSRGSSSCW